MSPEKLQLPTDFKPDAAQLVGRRILITGASRGLGQAIAIACAAAGADTILLARDVRALEATADAIVAAGHREPKLLPLNLEAAGVEHYAEVRDLLLAQCGALHGLVLNAGMLGELSAFANLEPTTWARVFQVNVHANFLLLQAFLPLLQAAERATVLAVSSGVGRRGRAYWGAYAASKFALEGMVEVLADEWRDNPGLAINSVNPGRCRTRMRAAAYPAEDVDTLPLPAALAPGFVYLLSDAASGFNGRQFDLQ